VYTYEQENASVKGRRRSRKRKEKGQRRRRRIHYNKLSISCCFEMSATRCRTEEKILVLYFKHHGVITAQMGEYSNGQDTMTLYSKHWL
jgi:hypothetical protein